MRKLKEAHAQMNEALKVRLEAERMRNVEEAGKISSLEKQVEENRLLVERMLDKENELDKLIEASK